MREGDGTTATAQREHHTMTSTGTTGDIATGTETEREKHKSTIVEGIGGIVREIQYHVDTPTMTEAGPIPVPDLDLL